MEEAVITPNQDAIISEVQINAPAERVFQALTDPRQLLRWWTSEECPTEYFEIEARPGASGASDRNPASWL